MRRRAPTITLRAADLAEPSRRREQFARRWLLAFTALLTGTVALSTAGVAAYGSLPGDVAFNGEMREQHLGWAIVTVARALNWLGQPLPSLFVTVALAVEVGRWLSRRHAVLVLATLGVTPITILIKAVVERSRPLVPGAFGDSFPSGHTSWAMATFGLIALLAARRSRPVLLGCLAVIALMGPSRLVLGVHWLSDVIVGYALGLTWLLVVLLVGLPWATGRQAAQPLDTASADEESDRA